MKNNKIIYKIVLIAIFAALAFVGTMIQIPLPSGGMVHLGNFFCILAGLLCGGVIGGLAGGLGCGLYDLLIYSDPIGFVQYFILKFVMGFVVGIIFRKVIKIKEFKYNIYLFVFSAILSVLSTLIIVGYLNDIFKLSSSINNKDLYIWIVTIVGYLFSLLIFIVAIFASYLKKIHKSVLFSTTLAVLINIVLECVIKIIFGISITNLSLDAALIKGISSLPSCILTGGLTVVVITIIYPKVFNATKHINQLNEIEDDFDE